MSQVQVILRLVRIEKGKESKAYHWDQKQILIWNGCKI